MKQKRISRYDEARTLQVHLKSSQNNKKILETKLSRASIKVERSRLKLSKYHARCLIKLIDPKEKEMIQFFSLPLHILEKDKLLVANLIVLILLNNQNIFNNWAFTINIEWIKEREKLEYKNIPPITQMKHFGKIEYPLNMFEKVRKYWKGYASFRLRRGTTFFEVQHFKIL